MAQKKPSSKGLSAEERAAMKDRMRELKSRASKEEEERGCVEQIDAMDAADRAIAKRLHALVKSTAPTLAPRLWYGMPAYAKDGKVICFFQAASKFKTRYATFGFSDKANLDEGEMWPVAFAIAKLTPAAEAKLAALVKRAAADS